MKVCPTRNCLLVSDKVRRDKFEFSFFTLTSTLHFPISLLSTKRITLAIPSFLAVTFPFSFTVATSSSDDLHVTFRLFITFPASNISLSPTFKVNSVAEIIGSFSSSSSNHEITVSVADFP